MVNQKVAEIASQAAATRMGEMIEEIKNGDFAFPEKSVYAVALEHLLISCEITPEIFEQRIRAFAKTQVPTRDVDSTVGNLLKESKRPEMGHKIFKRMIQALFPIDVPPVYIDVAKANMNEALDSYTGNRNG